MCPAGFQTDKLSVDNGGSEVKVRRRPEIHLLGEKREEKKNKEKKLTGRKKRRNERGVHEEDISTE